MQIADARKLFPATARWTYLDAASTGPMPTTSGDAARAFLLDAEANARSSDLWRAGLARARDGFARLIGADAADVAFTKNATEGVNIVAAGLGAGPGHRAMWELAR